MLHHLILIIVKSIVADLLLLPGGSPRGHGTGKGHATGNSANPVPGRLEQTLACYRAGQQPAR